MLTWLASGLVMGVGACRPSDVGPETARAFGEARQFRQSLAVSASRAPVTAADTARLLSLGYLERTRLGLGSPFRLVDLVLNDPRLPEPLRGRTAWAVLAMVYDGESYAVDPAALDSFFVVPAANGPGSAAAQARRIERVVLGAESPRAGELAVRLAYANASAERVLRSTAMMTAARAAAQSRDRAIARADVLELLRAARDQGRSAVQMVPEWRLARRFAVEQPMLAAPTPDEERAAVAAVPAILAELRSEGLSPLRGVVSPVLPPTRAYDPDDPDDRDDAVTGGGGPLLGIAAARHLAALPQVRALPPSPPVVVALAASRDRIVDEAGVPAPVRAARARFLDAATTEESLVAGYASLGELAGRHVAEAALWAASGLRPSAQERPWFPGSGGPSMDELRQRFGLAVVSFDREVPAEWRPYYRRMLATALDDMKRVFPDMSVAGLGVHFGLETLRSALAVHDPRTRTIFLPLGTGAGAIAHELAHDMDWQLSARAYRRHGQYGTDQAVKEQRGRLAESVRGLTTATLEAPDPANRFLPSHSKRPTEVFAASVDWFVAAALARDGRLDGYLTAVQDELLTGYASVPPPDMHGQSGEATLAVLEEMTTVPPPLQLWFRTHYGRERESSMLARARRVLELTAAPLPGAGRATASIGSRGAASWSGSASATLSTPALLPEMDMPPDPFQQWPACIANDGDSSPLAVARRKAAELAAESVARRMLAGHRPGAPGDPIALAVAGAPVDPSRLDAELRRLTTTVLDRVERAERERRPGC